MKSRYKLGFIVSGLFLSGCGFFAAPPREPVPPPPPTPKPDFFDPKDYVRQGIKLNDPSDPTKPTTFRCTQVDTGELLWIQSVKKIPGKTPKDPVQEQLGVPEQVRLEGIQTPDPGKPGFNEAVQAVRDWTLTGDAEATGNGTHAPDLDVEQDPQYPWDLQNHRMVQIFFASRHDGPFNGAELLLNRMMVRAGLAIVDLYQPLSSYVTATDNEGWLNDEVYAREHQPPLGLWGMGIPIGDRPLPPAPTSVPGAQSKVTVTQKVTRNGKTTTTVVTTGATAMPKAAARPGVMPRAGAAGRPSVTAPVGSGRLPAPAAPRPVR